MYLTWRYNVGWMVKGEGKRGKVVGLISSANKLTFANKKNLCTYLLLKLSHLSYLGAKVYKLILACVSSLIHFTFLFFSPISV